MIRTTLAAAAFTFSAFVAQAAAGESEFRPCQYNGGKWIQVRVIDNGGAFTYEWDDGPRMSYVWRGSNADRWNITDTLGGRWNFYDFRNGRGVKLTNLDNGNTIRCLGN